MRLVFDYQAYLDNNISPEKISEEVEMTGFSAELLEMIENHLAASPEDEELGTSTPSHILEGNSIKTCNLIITGMTCSSCQATI